MSRRFYPLDLRRLLHCGIRDFDIGQPKKIARHAISPVSGSKDGQSGFAARPDAALCETPFDRGVIHLDVDCLDTSLDRANEYMAPDGLGADDLVRCIGVTCDPVRPLAMTIAAFNPEFEGSDCVAAATGQIAGKTLGRSCRRWSRSRIARFIRLVVNRLVGLFSVKARIIDHTTRRAPCCMINGVGHLKIVGLMNLTRTASMLPPASLRAALGC